MMMMMSMMLIHIVMILQCMCTSTVLKASAWLLPTVKTIVPNLRPNVVMTPLQVGSPILYTNIVLQQQQQQQIDVGKNRLIIIM